jgi:hypothetical protein
MSPLLDADASPVLTVIEPDSSSPATPDATTTLPLGDDSPLEDDIVIPPLRLPPDSPL